MSHHDPFAPVDTARSAVSKDPDGNGRPDHLDSMRKPELVNLATTLGLDTGGNRDTLIGRVRDAQRDQRTPPAKDPGQGTLDAPTA